MAELIDDVGLIFSDGVASEHQAGVIQAIKRWPLGIGSRDG